jgi:glycosyltransferase involved in cell wall biosynthesis
LKRALLIVTGAYATGGGIAAVNRLVIRALSELGFSLSIYVLNEADPVKPDRLPGHLDGCIQAFRGDKQAFTISVWKALAKNAFDLVMVDHVNLASILAPAALAQRCKYFVWLFGIEVFPPRPSLEGVIGMRYAYRRLAISSYTRQRVLERFPNLSISICELALDPDRHAICDSQAQSLGQDGLRLTALDGSLQTIGGAMILHVGRMEPQERYKGQDVLLNAFPAIHTCYPDSQLVLVGQGQDASRLLALAHSLPRELQPAIFVTGYVDDEMLGRIYQHCHLFAMPSTSEGFGLVYLEAMARGKPCIGGSMDAAQCVIRNGETGLLVDDPRSAEQVANQICRLLDDPQLALRMGQSGLAQVCNHYLFAHFKQRLASEIKF